MFRRNVRTLCLFATLCALSAFARADYPSKPIRILVPFVPGGATDILARLVGQNLTQAWGQQVVVDNRPGANGIVAADLTAKATPDGHTLLFVAIGHAINPLLQKNLPYDTEKDFTAISLAAVLPLIVTVHPSVPVTNVKELINFAKSGPRRLNYASGGVGSSQHLATALFAHMAKIELSHIPYKGGNQGLLDLVAGQVDMMISTILSLSPHVKSGRLKALAVTSPKRNRAWPDLPTVSEAGLPGYQSQAWYGLVGPKNLPPDVLKKLSDETVRIIKSKEVQENLLGQGADPVGSSPSAFSAFIRAEMNRYAAVIRVTGVAAE
ncbi:MAG TPA: tripartite tricarboxylate transporter substrate binding protein [Burkholderiales bacterium]|jgi:tripartite-type tricarboxylate transporter receptor subunit TctC|nr:tripartite tricarboxylate transporter substrate binding protein [Burkholderiales bacterium]